MRPHRSSAYLRYVSNSCHVGRSRRGDSKREVAGRGESWERWTVATIKMLSPRHRTAVGQIIILRRRIVQWSSIELSSLTAFQQSLRGKSHLQGKIWSGDRLPLFSSQRRQDKRALWRNADNFLSVKMGYPIFCHAFLMELPTSSRLLCCPLCSTLCYVRRYLTRISRHIFVPPTTFYDSSQMHNYGIRRWWRSSCKRLCLHGYSWYTRFREGHTCFGCETKTGIVRISDIFQDRPMISHIIQKVSSRAFYWCGWS